MYALSYGCTVKLCVFFFNDTATTEIYTLSLHDALPIFRVSRRAIPFVRKNAPDFLQKMAHPQPNGQIEYRFWQRGGDRKSTRLNSSHANISYAVFCLKKKNKTRTLFRHGYYLLPTSSTY